MPFSGNNTNLLTETRIITHDGIFDDFFSSSATDDRLTNNAANSGSAYTQNIGELVIAAGGTATAAVKYQNQNALAPQRGLPWPTYVDITLETRLKTSNYATIAGFAVSHADEAFTTANKKFFVGIFYEGAGASASGLRIIDPGSTTTDYTTTNISLNTEYNLVVQLKFNLLVEDNYWLIHINAWLNGSLLIDDFTISRASIYGIRVDGMVGIATQIPTTVGNGGTVTYYYFCCNRMESILACSYVKASIFKTGDIKAVFGNSQNEWQQAIGPESLIFVYTRNDTTFQQLLQAKKANSFDVFDLADLAGSCILRYDFNGRVKDSSGNGRTFTRNGLTYTAYGDYYVGSFDGTNDYADLPDINIDWATSGYTISFWMNIDAHKDYNQLLALFTATGNNNYGIEIYIDTNGAISHIIYNSAGTATGTLTSANNLAIAGQWAFFVIRVFSGGRMEIFKDKIFKTTATASALPASQNRTINFIGQSRASTNFFAGDVRQFMIWNRVITAEEIGVLYDYGYLKSSDLADELIMKLDFNGNANDETDRYNGTLTGDASASLSWHGYRSVLDLDGTGDYVDLPDIDIDWLGAGFTFSLWLYFDTLTTDRAVFVFADNTANDNYLIDLYAETSDNSLRFRIFNATAVSQLSLNSAASSIAINTPYHVVITINANGAATMYINNSSAATGTATTMPPARLRGTNFIGNWRDGTLDMDGKVWDFCLWRRVLTTAEITNIFQAGKLQQRWSGFIEEIDREKDTDGKYVSATNYIAQFTGYHYSQLLAKRVLQGTFTAQLMSYILADATNGVIAGSTNGQATEFTVTNVKTSSKSLTKQFFQEKISDIIAWGASVEDYFAWVDEDYDVHFEPPGLTESGAIFEEGDGQLISFAPLDMSGFRYDQVEVQGTSVWTIVLNSSEAYNEGGKRIGILPDPSISTQARAQEEGYRLLNLGNQIQLFSLVTRSNYFVDVGETIQVTLADVSFGIIKKKFLVIEIRETPFDNLQEMLVTENFSSVADLLYNIYTVGDKANRKAIDISATKTRSQIFDFYVDVWCEYLAEWSVDGATWNTWASGRAVVTNRAIAILSGCLGNSNYTASEEPSEGNFANGLVFQIGTSSIPARITDTALGALITGTNKVITPANITITTSNGFGVSSAVASWDTTEANGYSIAEAGYYVDRQVPDTNRENTTHQYATTSFWSPYNVATQISCHAVFPAFTKNSGNYFRITFTMFNDRSIKKRSLI